MATDATTIQTTSPKRQFALNAASGVVAQGVMVGVGLVLIPYLISQLGTKAYGISQLAQSTLVFFSFLQLGMGPTLARYCSQTIARHDREATRKISSTAQFLLGILGLLGAFGIICFIPFFLKFYEIPPEMKYQASGLLFCLAVSFLLNFIFMVPQGLVLGSNRYDQANGVEIFTHLLRLGFILLTFWLFGPSLLLLGICILLAQFFRFTMYFSLAILHTGRSALFSIRWVNRETVKLLFGFSSLNLINTLANTLVIQGPVLIMGRVLGAEMVALFAPAVLVATAVEGFLGRISTPLVPLASKAQAENTPKKLGEWSVIVAGTGATLGLAVAIPFCVFGDQITGLWLGADMANVWIPIAIMLTGTVISQSAGANYFLAIGGGCIHPTVYSQIILGIACSIGVTIGMIYFGWQLIGVAIFITTCRCLRNVFYLTYAYSKPFLYSVSHYIWTVYAKPVLFASGVTVIGFIIKTLAHPDQLFLLGTEITILLMIYAVLAWYSLLAIEIQSGIRRLFFGFRSS